jgi:hypothetical protein
MLKQDKCQDKQTSCEKIKKMEICEIASEEVISENTICSWIKKGETDEGSCINEKSAEKCSYYTNELGCTETSSSICSWIKTEENKSMCIEVENLCNIITESKELCEMVNSSDGSKCVWLESNSNVVPVMSGRCLLKV